MNIKEHIEAGHYLVDDKGRALVRMADGDIFVVCATDKPRIGDRHNCIIGWRGRGIIDCFDVDGRSDEGVDVLLPPPPRKVKVKALAIVIAGTGTILALRDPDNPPVGIAAGAERLVTLTGEYEEPWDSKSTEA